MEVPFSTLGKSQKCCFGKSARFNNSNQPQGREFGERPSTGPARSCSFGIGERSSLVNTNALDCPSPDRYLLTPEPGIGAVIFGKPKTEASQQRVSQQPGPGAYNPLSSFVFKTKFTLRKRIHIKQRSYSPGPCAYKPNFQVIYSNRAGGFIPKSNHLQEFKKKRENAPPGPGAYKIPSCFGENKLHYPIVKYKKK